MRTTIDRWVSAGRLLWRAIRGSEKEHFLSEPAAVAAVVLIRTALCAFRAATQSFTFDESYTCRFFLSGSWRDLYFRYDANNHVLFSLLAKLSSSIFGDSEFALRLPSLIAGFLLMLGVWRLLERVNSRPVRWVAFAALALHPLILDLSIAARGYSLAAALLIWALYALIARRNLTAGILLGLAMSANLTAAFPAVGMVAAGFLLAEGSWQRRWRTLLELALPAAAVGFIVLGGALLVLRPANFFVGYHTIRESLFNLMYVSILSGSRAGLFGTRTAAYVLAFVVLPAITLLISAGLVLGWRRGDRRSLMAALALSIAALGIVAAHYLTGLLYPVDRTGISLMLLFGIAWAVAAGQMHNRLLRGANLVAGALIAAQFGTQLHVTFFSTWWYDRSTKEIAHRIEKEIQGKLPGSVSIGADWMYQSALEYYRVHDRVTALQPVGVGDPTQAVHDFYVLNLVCPPPHTPNGGTFTQTSCKDVLFSDPFAGVILASQARTSHPAFFTGESALPYDVYFLKFPGNGNLFGSYNYLFYPWLYHYDLGFEYVIYANDKDGSTYLYDSASGHTFYTSSSQFPYLYDFTLAAWLYYLPDANKQGHYTTKPRYFSNLATGKIFSM